MKVNTIEISATVSCVNGTFYANVPAELLADPYSSRPVMLRRGADPITRARLYRRSTGEVMLVLSARQAEAMKVEDGGRLECTVEVVGESLSSGSPQDLAEALLSAGIDWDEQPERERNWMIKLIMEAATPTIRKLRISRIVRSLGSDE